MHSREVRPSSLGTPVHTRFRPTYLPVSRSTIITNIETESHIKWGLCIQRLFSDTVLQSIKKTEIF